MGKSKLLKSGGVSTSSVVGENNKVSTVGPPTLLLQCDDGSSPVPMSVDAGRPVPSAEGAVAIVQCVKFNELLMFVQHFRDRASHAKLLESVLNFYSDCEISTAKKLLIDSFAIELSDCDSATERRTSTLRLAKEAEADDIINMLDIVDRKDVLCNVRFAALAYDRLPRYGPEELNVAAVVDKQIRTEQQLQDITSQLMTMSSTSPTSVERIAEAVERVDNEIRSSTHCLQEQINQLSSICSKLVQQTIQHIPPVVPQNNDNSDRSLNVVITGIEENNDSSIWKSMVTDVLYTAAGRDVSIADAFRLGRQSRHRLRPILVKMHSVWDRRLVLSGARKLASVEFFRGVFVRADETAEVRRMRIVERLKGRAERGGHVATMSDDGILSIDGQQVFSLAQGRLCEFNLY